MNLQHRPQLTSRLTFRERDGAIVATRKGESRAYILNAAGVVILEFCDGERTVHQLAEIIQIEFSLPEPPIADVWAFISEATKSGLIHAD